MNASTLKKLDDLADKRTLNVLVWFHFDGNYCDDRGELFTPLEPEEVRLPDRFMGLPFVEFRHKGKKRRLLLVAATAGTCSLIPDDPTRAAPKAMNRRDFKTVAAALDGWLVATTAGGLLPQLRFSVVQKEKWLAAGSPPVLDVSIAQKRRTKK